MCYHPFLAGTGSDLLGGDGGLKPDQAYSEAMATRWFQQELPVQKPGHRSKPTRKEMDDSENSDDDPAGVSRFSQNPVLIKTRCSSDSKIPGDSRSCTRDARTRFDQDPVQIRLEAS